MFRIFDSEYRRVVSDDLETREEAEKRLAELLEADPSAERALRILKAGQSGMRKVLTIEDGVGTSTADFVGPEPQMR